MPERQVFHAGSLHRLFSALVRRGFDDLGLQDEGLRDYVIDLLVRFARIDALYAIREPSGSRIDTVVGLLIEAERNTEAGATDATFRTMKHAGDYALFMSGIFRAYVERRGYLDWYLVEGPRSYRRALQAAPDARERDVLERLWRDFERVSGGIDYVRKVYFGRAALQQGLDSLVRRFEMWN